LGTCAVLARASSVAEVSVGLSMGVLAGFETTLPDWKTFRIPPIRRPRAIFWRKISQLRRSG
jgi:hypothetical protein